MGYQREDNGQYANTESVQAFNEEIGSSGLVSSWFESGDKRTANLVLETTAKSGTNPTLDVTIQTTHSKDNLPINAGSFTQQSDVGYAMGAVASAGTSPPTVTLSGTPTKDVNFKMECTTLGARGTAVVRVSSDGGITWTSNILTAATFLLPGTGLTINYANATAAVDNVWTASSKGYQQKTFALGKYWRAVCVIGGSSTPKMTAKLSGELS